MSEWLTKNLQTVSAEEGVGRKEPSYAAGGECKLVQTLRRTVEIPGKSKSRGPLEGRGSEARTGEMKVD